MKKFAALILACAMAVSIAACSPSQTPGSNPDPVSTSNPSSNPNPADPAPEEELGMDLSKYKYTDISHLQEANMPVDPALQLPQSDFFGRIGMEGGLHNLEVISYCVHTGTHMDAPYHVIEEAGGVDTVDPTILIGPACVIRLDVIGSYGITVDDVKAWEEEHGEIQPGEAVLFDTKQDSLWKEDPQEYITNYPYLLPETAQYLVDQGVRYVGCEAISPDTDTTESHKILLGNGVGVVENVCNLSDIPVDRCYTIGTFPNSQGSTGVWVRILAFYR